MKGQISKKKNKQKRKFFIKLSKMLKKWVKFNIFLLTSTKKLNYNTVIAITGGE